MTGKDHKGSARLSDGVERCLVIPEGLAGFQDADPVLVQGSAAIYHKLIKAEAIGVEFICSTPCLCFVMKGRETFLAPDGAEHVVEAGNMILLPRHTYLVSDFHDAHGPLEAFLFFFDPGTIGAFAAGVKRPFDGPGKRANAFLIEGREGLPAYMSTVPSLYKNVSGSQGLLRVKLLELLHLIAAIDGPNRLMDFLSGNREANGRKNIRHLIRHYRDCNLSVAEFARLSGRSVSAFHREFKRQYGVAPSRFLMEQRLARAKEALVSTQLSVTDIGLNAGFQSTSHFISQFKNVYGVTPRRLRMAVR
ncbi:helix-turn-helix transcriptional regulator [Roseibium sp.]|uniref:helix-turn-helix transcriptional regulator n=1 Tax=Roseibium sp. TaxID=1936156 RepID=UPI003BB1F9BA